MTTDTWQDKKRYARQTIEALATSAAYHGETAENLVNGFVERLGDEAQADLALQRAQVEALLAIGNSLERLGLLIEWQGIAVYTQSV